MRQWMLLVALAVSACMSSGGGGGGGLVVDDAGADRPATMCVAGETRSCACAGGTMGVQTCERDGSGFGACGMCPSAARCGDGMCNGTETCSSCAGDCGMCAARCGDGMCNGTETCSSCAGDCGMCAATPRCGDGMCNGTDTCMSCSDDCGACPPRCGDGSCNGTETCASCLMDCADRCETMCMSCAQNADCPSGYECGQRRCDGARGCYPTADRAAGCSLIGGIRCPATTAYNRCLTNAECGPFATCIQYGDGRSVCARRCTADVDCPSPPVGYSVVPRCNTGGMMQTCYLECTGPGTCPYGLSCFRYQDGRYGYCS